MASIPNLRTCTTVNKGSSSARFTWSLLGICQSMLANPTSIEQADIDAARRGADAGQRVQRGSSQQACGRYAGLCRYDGGAVVRRTTFTKAHISTRDYFHPSLAGQALLADARGPQTQWALVAR